VDFFICSYAAPRVADADHDRSLDEAHWAYMDRYAAGMVARGPLLGADRERWLGSVHIVGLPGPEAAREFVEREPYNRAGAYERHVIRRFENRLGRTMWDFSGPAGRPRFLAIAHAPAATPPGLAPESLIVHGELSTPVEASPAGAVWAFQAADRDAAESHFTAGVELFDWEFGGRR
jgi:uncharacterized protein YciI